MDRHQPTTNAIEITADEHRSHSEILMSTKFDTLGHTIEAGYKAIYAKPRVLSHISCTRGGSAIVSVLCTYMYAETGCVHCT